MQKRLKLANMRRKQGLSSINGGIFFFNDIVEMVWEADLKPERWKDVKPKFIIKYIKLVNC